jgi:hypothetical protein
LKVNASTSISPLWSSSVLSPEIPSSLRKMSADGPPPWSLPDPVSVPPNEPVPEPLSPGGPVGPLGPAGPVGPVWFQVSAFSFVAQVSVSSTIRATPVGVPVVE